MATVTTVDVTTSEGAAKLPQNTNDYLSLVETIASQNIRSLKSANAIIDGAYEYQINNGKVIEEAVIEMASAQAFDKTQANFAPTDPVVHPLYFNNYEAKQFKTTIRRDDIRAIVAGNSNETVEGIAAKVLDTLTQGESNYDFEQTRSAIYNANFKDYSNVLGSAQTGKVPSTITGVIYCLRDMYNHLKCNNSDLTVQAYKSATPESDIRIAVSTKLLNLIDVTELANVFNLEKEELWGKMVVIDVDDLSSRANDYMAYVYDVKAIGRATRIYDYTQDTIGSARYTNSYLTVERAYFHNGLFKGAKLDCTKACSTKLATLIEDVE